MRSWHFPYFIHSQKENIFLLNDFRFELWKKNTLIVGIVVLFLANPYFILTIFVLNLFHSIYYFSCINHYNSYLNYAIYSKMAQNLVKLIFIINRKFKAIVGSRAVSYPCYSMSTQVDATLHNWWKSLTQSSSLIGMHKAFKNELM